MPRWSIHLEDDKYVVRHGSTGNKGKKAGAYATRREAAAKVSALEAKEREEGRIAAAKELLGV